MKKLEKTNDPIIDKLIATKLWVLKPGGVLHNPNLFHIHSDMTGFWDGRYRMEITKLERKTKGCFYKISIYYTPYDPFNCVYNGRFNNYEELTAIIGNVSEKLLDPKRAEKKTYVQVKARRKKLVSDERMEELRMVAKFAEKSFAINGFALSDFDDLPLPDALIKKIRFDRDFNLLIPACKKFDLIYENDPVVEKSWASYRRLCDQMDEAAALYEADPLFCVLVKGIKWYNSIINSYKEKL